MMCEVCDAVIREKQRLTLLDSPIGDGDHGIGMSRGMTKAKSELEKTDSFRCIEDIFFRMGRTMIGIMGGSSGVVFGTMFMGAASGLIKNSELTAESIAAMMRNSLEKVKERGRSKPGEKTMVDALEPAVLAMEASSSKDLPRLMGIAADAAEKGAEATRDMIARHGHANTLGERALGHPDPGAVTVTIIFRAMENYLLCMDSSRELP